MSNVILVLRHKEATPRQLERATRNIAEMVNERASKETRQMNRAIAAALRPYLEKRGIRFR